MEQTASEIAKGLAAEMERLRTADLSTDKGFRDNLIFHIGFLDMAVYQLAKRVDQLEQRLQLGLGI